MVQVAGLTVMQQAQLQALQNRAAGLGSIAGCQTALMPSMKASRGVSSKPAPQNCLVGWGSERKMSGPAKHLKVCLAEPATSLQHG